MNKTQRLHPLFVGLVLLTALWLAAWAPRTAAETAEAETTETTAEAADTENADTAGTVKAGPQMSPEARVIGDPDHPEPPPEGSFGPDPSYEGATYDPEAQLDIYGGKRLVRTARPLIELGRRLYDRGVYTTRPTWMGKKNPIAAHFMVYGDLRTAVAYNDNGIQGSNGETHQTTFAARLNLDLDLKLTATERIHAFVRPLDKNGSFTRYEIDGKIEDETFDELDFNLETLYFEGDIGAIASGWSDENKKFDLPFAFGLVPILTQNGVWVEDAFLGLVFSFTAKNSPSMDISNMDFTIFAGFDEITTDAVGQNTVDPDEEAKLVGFAGFMDLWSGYLEYGYGYVDIELDELSYSNVTVAFSKRYGHTLSNSVRLIGNFGQDPVAGVDKTADGVLLLVENSLITSKPSTLIPYFNLFAGFDSPQSLARASGSGGVLRNTGINFETDGMTGFPTLDASGHDAWGGAFGVEYLFNLDRQIVVEAALVEPMDDNPKGSEYALGIRFQEPLTNAWILRADVMAGWRDGQEDLLGARLEIRRKF